MKISRRLLSRNWLIAGCNLICASACALAPAEWRFVQTLDVPAAGLIRLELPPETLGAARANLEDVRLVDGAGQEVPFLIERPVPEATRQQSPKSFRVSMEDSATVVVLESGMVAPVAAVSLESPARNFLKAVRVEGSHDGETWEPLAVGQPIFRLPEGIAALKIEFPPARWEYLKLTLDDRRSGPVPITRAQLYFQGTPAPTQSLALSIKSRDEAPGVTRLAVDLGAANLRIAELEFETGDPLFNRALSVAVPEVADETIHEQTVKEGFIYRVAVEGVTATGLNLALEQQIGARELIVLIRNQDSPALHITGVRAAVRPTRLVFLARDAGPLRLLTGNAQCPAARYDLAALSERLKNARSLEATLSPRQVNPGYQSADTLQGMAETGAELELKPWVYRKVVGLSAAGVQQLEVDPEVLSRANPSLSDLRLTREGRQVPFLFENTSISRALIPVLAPAPDPKRPQVSRWMLKFPYPQLPVTRLTLGSSSALFEREVRVLEKVSDPRGESAFHDLGRATWRRAPGTPGSAGSAGNLANSGNPGAVASDLELRLDRAPLTDTIFIETSNGDNPPIDLSSVRAYYPVTRLVFKASPQPGSLELAYGNPQALAPRYDLSLVARPLLAAPRNVATTSLESAATPKAEGEGTVTQILFWGVLAAVVAGLLAVLARLLPKASAD